MPKKRIAQLRASPPFAIIARAAAVISAAWHSVIYHSLREDSKRFRGMCYRCARRTSRDRASTRRAVARSARITRVKNHLPHPNARNERDDGVWGKRKIGGKKRKKIAEKTRILALQSTNSFCTNCILPWLFSCSFLVSIRSTTVSELTQTGDGPGRRRSIIIRRTTNVFIANEYANRTRGLILSI